jgi:hypothetical protein
MGILSSGQQSAIWYQPDASDAKTRCQLLSFEHWSDQAKGDESCIVADAKTNVSGYAALLPAIMATMRSNIDSSLPRYEPLADNIDNTQTGGLSSLLHALGSKKRQREGTVDETFEKNREKCNRRKAKVPKGPKPRPSSGYYGVRASGSGKRWQAKIYYDNKDHYLGSFDTKQEAALAYDREARQRGVVVINGPFVQILNYESIAAAEEAAVQANPAHTLAHSKQLKPRPSSGFYGVSAAKKRWMARITYDGKQHNLGSFDTKQEAALAYDREARQCGKDTALNYESTAAAGAAAAAAAQVPQEAAGVG